MVRRLLNWICPIVLLLVYMKALFLDPTAIEGEMSPTVAGTIPSETWLAMSPTARGLAPQLAGWGCILGEVVPRPHPVVASLISFWPWHVAHSPTCSLYRVWVYQSLF